MSAEKLVCYLLIGFLIGWISSLMVAGRGRGVAADMAVGMVGAFIGAHLAHSLGPRIFGVLGALSMAILGSVVFLLVLRALVLPGGRRRG